MKTQKMKEMKKNLISLPTPSNISYLWNMGSILAMCLSLQIVTGIMISMQFSTNLLSTFEQVMMMSRNITSGWPLRMLHTLGATLFFIFMFTHMSRNLWINSPKTKQKTWITGMIMLILTMMTAFLGYVLPWGQMSFWGATVITNMLSAIPYLGKSAVTWLWGNFSVSQPTLNRFFSLHFLMPMVIAMLSLIHLMSLHSTGSSTTTSNMTVMEKTSFHPYFSTKDTTPLLLITLTSMLIITHIPYSTLDPENFMEANPLSTPTHIQPEWYFLFAYAILRAIPSKLGGVLALVASVLVFMLPMMTKKSMSTTKFKPTKKMKLWFLLAILLILTWIGANPVEDPYVKTGQVTSATFFFMMILAMNCFLHKIKPWKFNKESFLEN